MPETKARTAPTLKMVMTATAFELVQIRNTWRNYFRALKAEREARTK